MGVSCVKPVGCELEDAIVVVVVVEEVGCGEGEAAFDDGRLRFDVVLVEPFVLPFDSVFARASFVSSFNFTPVVGVVEDGFEL